MKGNWHFIAIAAVVSILTALFHSYWFFICFLFWLFYLFLTGRLEKLPLVFSLIFLLFFSIFLPTKEMNVDKMKTDLPEGKQTLVGKIVRPVSVTNSKLDFIFQETYSKSKLIVLFFPDKDKQLMKGDLLPLKYGATCHIEGKIDYPEESRNPGQFNLRNYFHQQGLTSQLIVHSLHDINCESSSTLHFIYSLRVKIIQFVNNHLSEETAPWLVALVLGDDSLLSEEIVQMFQRWSLSHILAISGLHVGLIVTILYFLLIKSSLLTKEKAQWIMIFFLPIYALLAGGQPSVWRASTMVLLFILLNKLKIKWSASDILSVIFVFLIMFDKYIIYHVGFQLSFLVTLGLILSKDWFSQSNSVIYNIFQISFISQMMILPLQLSYFHLFQPLSIVLNVIVVPYFSLFVIPYMVFLLFLAPFPLTMITFFDGLFASVHRVFLSFIDIVDQTVNYPFVIGDFPIVFAVIYYWLFLLLMKNISKNKLGHSFKYSCLITIFIIFLAVRPYLSPVGSVTMLDIGQGDAFIIELPYRRAVFLIDAGASFSFEDMQPSSKVYKSVIKPYLYSKGINSIDAIFLSHKDIDHIGSVTFLIEEINVREILVSEYYNLEGEEVLNWRKKGIAVNKMKYNDKISLHGQLFHALSPKVDKQDDNENSLVLYVNLGGKSWLFTGDIGVKTEEEMLKHHVNLDVDVLKVGHHGSNTSTSKLFINKIKPMYALISAGKNNRYGHPTNEVLGTLTEENVHIMRTDTDGAIQFRYKDNSGTFYKFLP